MTKAFASRFPKQTAEPDSSSVRRNRPASPIEFRVALTDGTVELLRGPLLICGGQKLRSGRAVIAHSIPTSLKTVGCARALIQ
jgi:hypothetical protein